MSTTAYAASNWAPTITWSSRFRLPNCCCASALLRRGVVRDRTSWIFQVADSSSTCAPQVTRQGSTSCSPQGIPAAAPTGQAQGRALSRTIIASEVWDRFRQRHQCGRCRHQAPARQDRNPFEHKLIHGTASLMFAEGHEHLAQAVADGARDFLFALIACAIVTTSACTCIRRPGRRWKPGRLFPDRRGRAFSPSAADLYNVKQMEDQPTCLKPCWQRAGCADVRLPGQAPFVRVNPTTYRRKWRREPGQQLTLAQLHTGERADGVRGAGYRQWPMSAATAPGSDYRRHVMTQESHIRRYYWR